MASTISRNNISRFNRVLALLAVVVFAVMIAYKQW